MKHVSVQELFTQAAAQHRDRVAIERGDERISYGALAENSNRLANYLRAAGLRKGDIVGLLADDTIEVITAIIGVLQVGGVFVPLDPRIPEARLRAMSAEVTPQWLLTQVKFIATLRHVAGDNAQARIIVLDGVAPSDTDGNAALDGVEFYAAHPDATRPAAQSEPDDMCYVYFTSGSTGRPKGIAGRLKGLDHFIRWESKTFGVGAGTRVSQLTSPSFDAYLRDVFTPLCAGGTVCAPPSRETVFDAALLVAWLTEQRVEIVHCVPSLFRSLLNQPLAPTDFPALKYVLMAGEPLLPSDVKRWTDVFGDRVRLVNFYGPTETTMIKFCYFVQPADKERRTIPIGQPIEGARALVLDAQRQACPPGAVGEIYIRTPYRTLGYYKQPELTAEVFVPNPFNDDPSDLVYRTGDLGRILDDGNFEFLGRQDQQVKVRGVRIELREIEDLLRGHAGVRDVAVVDLEDSGGNKYLCAYVVTGDGADAATLKEFLAASLPDYVLPSAFVVLAELPRTISGKVDRRALPRPADEHARRGGEYVAPRTPVEEELAAIWCQVLNVERVSVEHNFFELGGHSLLATQLLARVRAAMQVELPLRALFAAPTVAGLASAVMALRAEQSGDEELAQMIEEIEQLSEADLDAVLRAEAEASESVVAEQSSRAESR
jgi:amino acid adenylation domain-containing protein